jgi:hypothetical protein
MLKIDINESAQISQTSVSSIIEHVFVPIIFGIKPFFFELSPNRFGNVQMRAVRRQESNEQSSCLPKKDSFFYDLSPVHAGIIQDQHRFLLDFKRKFFRIFHHCLSSNIMLCHHSHIFAFSADESKIIDPVSLFYRNVGVFSGKLPTIRYISLRTYMRFITVIKVYLSCLAQMFQLSNYRYLVTIIFRVRFIFRAKPYPFISSVKTFKKQRRVLSLMVFPRLASHSALAVRKRCRWDLMAASRPSLFIFGIKHWLMVLAGFGMQAGDTFQLETLYPGVYAHMAHAGDKPTSFELRPSAFSSMTWQRLRKQWLSPDLNPSSKYIRSDSLSAGVLTRPMTVKIDNNIKYFREHI